MDLQFLGTSSGTPTRSRNVAGLALHAPQGRDWFLIDCGEGTQHQLLHTKTSLRDLRAICITHVHGDHCYGLPGLLASASLQGRPTPLTIVAPEGIAAWLDATLALTALHLSYPLTFVATESLLGNAPLTFGAVQIQATALSHRVPSYAYSFGELVSTQALNTERLRLDGIPAGPLWGQLQRGQDVVYRGQIVGAARYLIPPTDPARKIVVAGDNDQPQLLAEACRDSQVLIHEATYTAEVARKVGPAVGHSHAGLVAQFAADVGLPNLVLTHFSPRYHAQREGSPSLKDLRAEAAAVYSGQLFLASDLDRYQLSKSGQLTRADA